MMRLRTHSFPSENGGNEFHSQLQILHSSCRALGAAAYQLAAWFEEQSNACWSENKADDYRNAELQCRQAFRDLTRFLGDLEKRRDLAAIHEYLATRIGFWSTYAGVFRALAEEDPTCFSALSMTSECWHKIGDHIHRILSRPQVVVSPRRVMG
jgi:hypothetical protein